MSKQLKNKIYYAQNREDLILEAFFTKKKKGFYVDIGACHPDIASVTKRFYLNGWHGINIEPQHDLYKLFVRDRSRDININIGISDKESEAKIRSYTNNMGMSTIVPEVQKEYESEAKNNTQSYKDVSIKLRTLSSIFREHKVKTIDFMKVDVEGFEYEVLNGNDWSKYRPKVICIEANHIVKDWRPILSKHEYKKVFFDGLNEYYVDSNTDIDKEFDFVQHVVMELKGGIAFEDFAVIENLESVNQHQSKHIKALENQIVNQKEGLHGIKASTGSLIQAIINKLNPPR